MNTSCKAEVDASTDRTSRPIGPHLLSIIDYDRADLEHILDLADAFEEVSRRRTPVPALSGKTIAWLFSEDSTRTRLSFEIAAKRLSAVTVNFTVKSSSMNKGESLLDTVETLEAMGVDGIVVRHACPGVPLQISQWVENASVVNGGDGCHEHPTQALNDLHTARSRLGSVNGAHVAFVGDIRHSRVAGSGVHAFSAMGANVTLVAPVPLLPNSLAGWPVAVTHDFDSVLDDIDICYMVRTQSERQAEACVPSLGELRAEYGLTTARADRLPENALIMHPGPMNRGVELDGEVADRPNAVVTTQVASGVPVRMAVLFLLLGSESGFDISKALDVVAA
ncbi:MAG: aspartate carbamoyltransferase catalytic subunit [Acidimicrobiaceae bacterium]|nr:aspartate carbamoyltransferase catalytic subunit [Acidimicrobiaceae bacterium]